MEPIAVSVTELTACKGIDETGNPVEISDTFPPEIERIYICGYVETVQPINLDIYWYRENELIYKENGMNIKGRFYGFIQPRDGQKFIEANYKVEIRAFGTLARSVEFRVESR